MHAPWTLRVCWGGEHYEAHAAEAHVAEIHADEIHAAEI